VKAIADRQPADTQNLVRDLLAVATTTTNPAAAAKALDVATQLTPTLRNQKRPASADFFQATISTANQNKNPSLDAPFLKLQTQLAAYRSALQPTPPRNHTAIDCTVGFKAENAIAGGQPLIADVNIENYPQTLDGYYWKNVAFVNPRIKSHGGPLHLENVAFVNCTFEVEGDSSGARVLQYAALDDKELAIGTLPVPPPTPN
jgi:hypothetical protein